MASQHQTDSLTEELICPVCLDLFTDPVILDCSHSFCRSCITRCWEKPGPSSCPVCQETFLERNLRVSRALGNLSEKARELKLTPNVTGIKRRCEKHQKQLRLFCETDKKLICSICRDAQEHRDHSFLPIDEAAEIYKDKVNSSLASLTQRKAAALEAEGKQKEKISQVKVSCVGADVWALSRVSLFTVRSVMSDASFCRNRRTICRTTSRLSLPKCTRASLTESSV
uniref:RING-type E3 ubiquitin transferase n=1 Tax=Callorhinchus milii TaxID=7868 RepID=A0A4W3GXS2_CALMI